MRLDSAIRTVKDLEGPVYVRLGRNPVPLIHDEDYSFELGKAVQKRPGMDLSIMATGCMVFKALETADLLDRQYGIQARVYNVHTIKPIDLETVERAASETKRIVTVEDHSIIGGLGGAIAEVVGERFPVPISPGRPARHILRVGGSRRSSRCVWDEYSTHCRCMSSSIRLGNLSSDV